MFAMTSSSEIFGAVISTIPCPALPPDNFLVSHIMERDEGLERETRRATELLEREKAFDTATNTKKRATMDLMADIILKLS